MFRRRILGTSVFLVLAIVSTTSAQINAVRGKVVEINPQGLLVQPTDSSSDKAVAITANAKTPVLLNYLASVDKILPGTYVQMQVLWDGANHLRATSIKLPHGRPTKFGLFEG